MTTPFALYLFSVRENKADMWFCANGFRNNAPFFNGEFSGI
nr:MAG TPA: hypothetical protein [Caudoviricetes sp.]